jgi:GNAT superfamily N-acetyltransferase
MHAEPLTSLTLTAADVADALALSDAAGWNQTADDWALFIAQGCVFGWRSPRHELVASGAALPYGEGQGWISMVLVAPSFRHRGLASELLNEGIGWLGARGLKPVLDATPAGAQVYQRLGFVPGMAFERWEHPRAAVAAPPVELRRSGLPDLDALVVADTAASRVGRRGLLQSFLQRPGTQAWITDDEQGFVIARAGRRAVQIGPLVAADEAAAWTLLQQALSATSGPVFLDLPTRWAQLAAHLSAAGFRPQRPFVRMALGDAPALAGSERLFVLAGPEFG